MERLVLIDGKTSGINVDEKLYVPVYTHDEQKNSVKLV